MGGSLVFNFYFRIYHWRMCRVCMNSPKLSMLYHWGTHASFLSWSSLINWVPDQGRYIWSLKSHLCFSNISLPMEYCNRSLLWTINLVNYNTYLWINSLSKVEVRLAACTYYCSLSLNSLRFCLSMLIK